MRRISLPQRHRVRADPSGAAEQTLADVVHWLQIAATEGLHAARFGAMTGLVAA